MNLSLSLIYFIWRTVSPKIASLRQGGHGQMHHHSLMRRAG